MTTYNPEYRLTLFAPRSVDPNEATILTPATGSIHRDLFRVTTMQSATNVCVQPGFEVSTLGTFANISTITRDQTNVLEGAWSLKVTTTNAGGSGVYFRDKDGNSFPVSAGETWTASVYCFGTGGAIGKVMQLGIEWKDSTAATIAVSLINFTIASGWNRVLLSKLAPVGTTQATVTFYTDSALGVFDFWLDNQQFEKSTSASPFTNYRPYLGYPRGRTGRVNVLERTTDVGSMSFDVNDTALVPGVNANRWASAFLGTSIGDPQLGGVKCFVEESLDNGATWAAYFTGHVKSFALNGRRGYTLTVRDMMYELTKLPLFHQPPHSSVTYVAKPLLMPLGMSASYGVLTATPDLTATISSPVTLGGSTVEGVAMVKLDVASIRRPDNFVTKNLLQTVAPDIRKHVGGLLNLTVAYPNFKGTARAHLTWNGGANQGDFRVGLLALGAYGASFAGIGSALQQLSLGHSSVHTFCIAPLEDTADLGYSALPANGTAVSFRIFADYKMQDGAALLLDTSSPLTILADVLNGKFSPLWRSPEALPPGKAYGDVHRTFTHTVAPSGKNSLPPIRLVIDKPVDNALEWAQKQLLKPYGLALIVNGSGSFSVVDLALPVALGGLPTITDTDVVLGETPHWEFDRDQAIYKAEGVLWEDFALRIDEIKNSKDKYPEFTKLLLDSVDHPQIVLGIGSPNFGDKTWKMGGDGFRTMEGDGTFGNRARPEYMADKIKEQIDAIRRPFSHGAMTIELTCRRTATVAALLQGQAVKVNVSTIPNPETNKRGGTRVCRIVEITRDVLQTKIRFLDLGVDTTTGTPTLGTLTLGSDPRHTATISVTLNSHPAQVQFSLTTGGSAPAEDDAAWQAFDIIRSSQTITLKALTPGKRVWVRARSLPLPAHGFLVGPPSAWVVSNSVDLTAYETPTGLTVTDITSTSAIVRWNSTASLWTTIAIRSPDSGAYTPIGNVLPGSTSWPLYNLAPSTVYGVQVTFHSSHGLLSTSVTTSFTTASGGPFIHPRPPILTRYKF